MNTQTTTPVLEFLDVIKEFNSGDSKLRVIDQLNFKIFESETVAITGPSGSGKSTLLGLMAGLDRVTAGQILFSGEPLHTWDEEKLARWRQSEVGFVFQNFRLIKSFTALENVAFPLEVLGHPLKEAEAKARHLLEQLGMGPRLKHYPNQLSGGEQQRVAIARAYIHQAKLIFADEPTGSLDYETAQKVLKSLLQLNSEQQTTLVVVTHDPAVADLMDRKVSLVQGKIAV